jgi:hypothetical protein
MVQENLCQFSKFGWSIVEYLCIPHRLPRKGKWESFMKQLFRIIIKCSKVNLNKLDGNTKT